MEENKESVDNVLAIKELETKIESMKKDKNAKCKAAKEQLVDMLEVTVDKYQTATGTAEAVRVLRFIMGEFWTIRPEDLVKMANDLAYDMAKETNRMLEKAKKLDYGKMNELCNGFYEKQWKPSGKNSVYELAFDMMRIDLCRNVGGSAEDMVDFIKRVDEEIKTTGEALKELRNKKED